MQIEDGTGKGYKVKVTENNRIEAKAVSISGEESNAEVGRTFNINTGNMTLTSANESAVLYIKNNGSRDIKITRIGYLLGASTGGAGDLLAIVKRNPTSGTIVSGATDTDIEANKNFGSSNVLTIDAYKGAEGLTLTNGTDAFQSLLPSSSQAYSIDTGVIILPQGASLGVTITPQTGNTSMDLQVFAAITEDTL